MSAKHRVIATRAPAPVAPANKPVLTIVASAAPASNGSTMTRAQMERDRAVKDAAAKKAAQDAKDRAANEARDAAAYAAYGVNAATLARVAGQTCKVRGYTFVGWRGVNAAPIKPVDGSRPRAPRADKPAGDGRGPQHLYRVLNVDVVTAVAADNPCKGKTAEAMELLRGFVGHTVKDVVAATKDSNKFMRDYVQNLAWRGLVTLN